MAANRPHVPKFGDWKEDAPFTVVFEKASRTKQNANMSNPIQYPDMNPHRLQTPNHIQDQQPNHTVRSRHERFSSREETEFRSSSPAHSERNNRVRTPPPRETYNHQPYGGGGRSHGHPPETNRRQAHEPPQPRPQIRNVRGPSSERVAIPPFPGSGSENQSYTMIFEKVKEDRRQSGNMRSYNGSAQTTPSRPLVNDQHHQPLPSSPKSCCFPPWGRK